MEIISLMIYTRSDQRCTASALSNSVPFNKIVAIKGEEVWWWIWRETVSNNVFVGPCC